MLNTAPPAIGTTTPAAGGFTTLDTTGLYTTTETVAPASPAGGRLAIYADSTQHILSSKSSGGVISNTVVPSSAVSNQYVTGLSTAGVISRAQPTCSNLSDAAATCSSALLSSTTGTCRSIDSTAALAPAHLHSGAVTALGHLLHLQPT